MSKPIGSIQSLKVEIQEEARLGVSIVTGSRGKSAYEVWLDEGNKGTIEDFLESLKAVNIQLDYEKLIGKPSIEMVELVGNKTFEDLGIVSIEEKELGNIF